MPVYDSARYVEAAVESILNQTLRDFEFIIVNDGSRDHSQTAIGRHPDRRILLVDRKHQGLVASLNLGLSLARGKYVARMDSDDVALPGRLERQVAFLDAHPETGILGTACRLIDEDGHGLGLRRFPANDLCVRWTSLTNSPFAHSTVLIRRDVLLRRGLSYDDAMQSVEDYDLWVRLLNYTCGANLSEPLMRYRIHKKSVTSQYRELQLRNHESVSLHAFREHLPAYPITPEKISQLRGGLVGARMGDPAVETQRLAIAEVYLEVLKAFRARHYRNPDLRTVQHLAALSASRLVLQPPVQRGWIRVLAHLLAIDPCLPFILLGSLTDAARNTKTLLHSANRGRGWMRHIASALVPNYNRTK